MVTDVGQHSISDMILRGIEALANRRESVRLSREKMWIRRVHTIRPHGLNINEGKDEFLLFSSQKCLHFFTFVLHLFCLFCLLVYLLVLFYTPFLTHCFSLIS